MAWKVLITGGAGFIGSFVSDALVARGDFVRVLDNLTPQVHPDGRPPSYLNPKVEFIYGDVRNPADLEQALEGMDVVIHNASAVGIAQSQYEVARFCETNIQGTANLFDLIINKKINLRKVIIPASMSSYGEGLYRCPEHKTVRPGLRLPGQMAGKDWELHCPICRTMLEPIPTPEEVERHCYSIYALTKRDQEDMALLLGRLYGIPVVALRYFNVYGPRQSMSNPYTGVTAIFLSRLKNGKRPVIYEDGLQTRDFISVHDVVRANLLAMESTSANHTCINIGSGVPIAIRDLAIQLARMLNLGIEPEIGERYRLNDIRHCYADMTRARAILGFQSVVTFDQGMRELIEWSTGEPAPDKFEQAAAQLRSFGLEGE